MGAFAFFLIIMQVILVLVVLPLCMVVQMLYMLVKAMGGETAEMPGIAKMILLIW